MLGNKSDSRGKALVAPNHTNRGHVAVGVRVLREIRTELIPDT